MALPLAQRQTWLDLLKAIAIFMMIAVHCTDNVTPAERSAPWYNLWGSLYGSFLRPAIPIFVMVTGALLLPVRQELTQFYRKRLARVAVPFLIWSVIYNLFPWVTGLLGLPASVINDFFVWGEPTQAFSDALRNVALIPFRFTAYATQMWYVYLLLGIYLYLPFFSAWVRQSTSREQHVFLGLWFVSLFLPYLRQWLGPDLWGVCSWNEFGLLYYFAGFNGYLLLGHYLAQQPVTQSWSKLLAWTIPLFALGYCVTFFGFKAVTAIPGQPESMVELFYTYCSPNVLFMTLPLFLIARKARIESVGLRRALASLSTCTLGIWMSHYLFVGPCYGMVEGWPIPTLLRMIICSCIVLGLTWGFVALVRRLPSVGKWLVG